MKSRWVVFVVVGSVLFPTLVALSAAACRVEAKQFKAAPQRIGEYGVTVELDPNPPKSGRRMSLMVTITRSGKPVEATDVEPHLTVDMSEIPLGHPE